MTDPTPTPEAPPQLPSSLRCWLGSLMAGVLAVAFYFLTQKIAHAFALHPLHTSNQATSNIAIAVRTLVVGMSTLGMGIFGLASLGLFGLGVQVSLQKFTKPNS